MKFPLSMAGGLMLAALVLPVQAETGVDTPDIDAEALSILKTMTDHLTSAQNFAYRAEYSYDVVQESGVKVEFGASRKILVSRPDRMRADSQRRDGFRSVVVFDGDNIWAYAPDENVYATTDQIGDLDDTLDFAIAELRIKAPMAELVSPDLYEVVTAGLARAYYLGGTVVAGVACHHLLLSNDYADFQLWIASEDQPTLRRIIITYREEPGEPQFRGFLAEWDMSPEGVEERLSFDLPEGAERVRFHVPAPAEQVLEDES